MTWRVAYNLPNKRVNTIGTIGAVHDEYFPCRKGSESFTRAAASAAHLDVVASEAASPARRALIGCASRVVTSLEGP
jgi:hypothetical protein